MKPQRDLTDEGRPAIRPTPERLRHDAIEVPLVDRTNQIARPARVETQSTLDRYKRRKTLDEDQLAAAMKYHAHFILSRRHGVKSMSFDGRVSGGRSDASDMALAAGISRDKAMSFLDAVNRDYRSVAEWVCVDDLAAEAWAIRHGLKPWNGIVFLRSALDALATHYGIKK